ncbi:MAG: response regulator [Gemmatimonas sp.]
MAFNVLVVDDSAVMRAMVVRTLKMSGVPLGDIHEASNGEDGLRLLGEEWIDLVMLDINMPVMNGEEMLRRMRGNPDTQETRVIVVSTEGSETRLAVLQEMGATIVHKPFAPATLRNTILSVTGVSDAEYYGAVSVAGDDGDF